MCTTVTFMPRWTEDADSQSIHLHVSLADKAGKAVFHDPEGKNGVSQRFRHFLGGLQRYVGDMTLIFQPTVKDFESAELRPLLDLYYRGRNTSAADRTRLSKLAWEMTGDSFGGRQQLYERLHSGDPNTLLAALYQRYDHSRPVAMVNKLLGTNFQVA